MSLNLLQTKASPYLTHLDWDQVINDITMVSYFSSTKDLFRLPPTPKKKKQIEHELDCLDFFLKRIDDLTSTVRSALGSLPSKRDHREIVKLIEKGHICTIEELNHACLILESYYDIFPSLNGWPEYSPYLENHENIRQIERKFLKPFRRFVDFNGNVDYARHPELSKYFHELQTLEKGLRNQIGLIAKEPLYSDAIQFDGYDVLNDRYVLAIRSDSYKGEQGPIIARSNTGMTLFVEPFAMRERSNKRMQLLAKIEEVLGKIAIDFSNILQEKSHAFSLTTELLYAIDILNTKAQYCDRLKLCRPIITDDFQLTLRNLYHPLIEDPVKNTVEIDSEKKGLIISGPNTGGKTVTLKSIALSHLFLHLGLFIPATEAVLYPVQSIYYFGNDQQNLERGLSSFASETTNYLNLLNELNHPALIIVDEIFNSTSSEEASALAIALLEEIHSRSLSKVVISTHHQVFKTFIHGNTDYLSAHVGYDLEKQSPTYKIFIGEPGSSMAFTIFEKLSSLQKIISNIPNKAKKILDKKQVSYEKLLQDLSQRKAELDKLLIENRSINNELRNQKKSIEGLVHLEKEKIISEYQGKIEKILKQAEEHFYEAKRGKIESAKAFYKKSSSISSEIDSQQKRMKGDRKPDISQSLKPVKFEEIEIGETYFSIMLHKEVKVLSINPRKKEVQISKKGISIWRPFTDLRASSNKSQKVVDIPVSIERTITGKVEIDCRGMRLEEFKRHVDTSLGELMAGDIPFLTIVHGHGTGVLKKWLREHIKTTEGLEWEPLDGNDGCTKVLIS